MTVSREPGSAQAASTAALPYDLTDAERHVMRLVAEGLTNGQVARRLSRSPHTVNYHLRGIFRKLGISSRVELARVFYLMNSAGLSN